VTSDSQEKCSRNLFKAIVCYSVFCVIPEGKAEMLFVYGENYIILTVTFGKEG
jgi:hypothetical protein